MKGFAIRGGLLFVVAAITSAAFADDQHRWNIEAGAFFPQEETQALIGDTTFLADITLDLITSPSGAKTSVGFSWTGRKDSGNEVQAGGAFLRYAWYGRDKGPFAGFDVGIFSSRVAFADNGGDFQPGSGTDTQLGVGASIFAGFMFGDRIAIRGGYSLYPSAGGVNINGFFSTIGYRF